MTLRSYAVFCAPYIGDALPSSLVLRQLQVEGGERGLEGVSFLKDEKSEKASDVKTIRKWKT